MKIINYDKKSGYSNRVQEPLTKDDFIYNKDTFIDDIKNKAKNVEGLSCNVIINKAKVDIFNYDTNIGIIFSSYNDLINYNDYKIYLYDIDFDDLPKSKKIINKMLLGKANIIKANVKVNGVFDNFNYNNAYSETKKAVETFVFNNYEEFLGKSLVNPFFTPVESRVIAYLKELKMKQKVLGIEDEKLTKITPEAQTRYYLLMPKDSVDNYKYILKVEKELKDLGVIIINYNNFVVVVDKSKNLTQQILDLKNITNIINTKIYDTGLIPSKNKNILFTSKNLTNKDMTYEDYLANPKLLENDKIVKATKELGFNVRVIFKEEPVKLDIYDESVDKSDNLLG